MKNIIKVLSLLTLSLFWSIGNAQVTPTSPGSTVQGRPCGSAGAPIATSLTDCQASLSDKPSVGLVATTNLTLSGAQTIDSVLGTAGTTLVLATAQGTASQNGPWIMQSSTWIRPTWYASGSTTQAFQFIQTLVRLGTVYQGSIWRMTTSGAITIDTTATTWVVTPAALNTHTVTGTLPSVNGGALNISFYQCLINNGAALNDTGDDGAVWNTCFAACSYTARCAADLPPGITSKINTGITLISGAQSADLKGVTFDASGMTTGCITEGSGCYALVVGPTTPGINYSYAASQPIGGFTLLGPNVNTSNVDGMFWGRISSDGNVTIQNLHDFYVSGFRDDWFFG